MSEELLKELDNILSSEKTKEMFKNYISYIKLRNEGKVKFGTYNIYIRNKSRQMVPEQLIKLIWKTLKTNHVIKTQYKYLEKNNNWNRNQKNSKKEKIFKVAQEDLCIIDVDKLDINLGFVKNDVRKYIQEYPEKVFIIVEKENTSYFFYDEEETLEEIDENFGDLFNWTMEIEAASQEKNKKYIYQFLKNNSIKLDKNSTFAEILSEEKYCKIKSELQNIVLECKEQNIQKITDDVVKKELNKKYYNKSLKNKLPPMKELNSMIGIEKVKEQVEQIVNYVKINKDKGTFPSLHMCFLGNPGTGKTTVARIIGRLFAEMKILSDKEKFVEAQRVDLIGEYIGSTAPKTKRKIEQANGGGEGMIYLICIYSKLKNKTTIELLKRIKRDNKTFKKRFLMRIENFIENFEDENNILNINYETYDDKLNAVSTSPVEGCSSANKASADRIQKCFNTSFFPDIIISTDVFKEGIDLQVNCSNIIHYGIAWLQGDIEQRIGRIDRYFSKTYRDIEQGNQNARINVNFIYMENSVDENQVSNIIGKMIDGIKTLDSFYNERGSEVDHTQEYDSVESKIDEINEFSKK